MRVAITIARFLLAVIYLLYGLNFFLHFIPTTLPPGKGGEFEGALIRSGYFFQYMKAMQIIGSLLLFTNRYTVFVAVVLFPISLNIFLFHAFLAPKGMVTAVLLLAGNLFLLYGYRKYYQSIFTKLAA